jgi:hypothetical protein
MIDPQNAALLLGGIGKTGDRQHVNNSGGKRSHAPHGSLLGWFGLMAGRLRQNDTMAGRPRNRQRRCQYWHFD